MDTIDGMRTFLAVVSEGSFSRAAERLNMSPQLVSKYVAQLEERLEVRVGLQALHILGFDQRYVDLARLRMGQPQARPVGRKRRGRRHQRGRHDSAQEVLLRRPAAVESEPSRNPA